MVSATAVIRESIGRNSGACSSAVASDSPCTTCEQTRSTRLASRRFGSMSPITRSESSNVTPLSTKSPMPREKAAVPERRRILPMIGVRRRMASSASRPAEWRRTTSQVTITETPPIRMYRAFKRTQDDMFMSICVIAGSATFPDRRNSEILGMTTATR